MDREDREWKLEAAAREAVEAWRQLYEARSWDNARQRNALADRMRRLAALLEKTTD